MTDQSMAETARDLAQAQIVIAEHAGLSADQLIDLLLSAAAYVQAGHMADLSIMPEELAVAQRRYQTLLQLWIASGVPRADRGLGGVESAITQGQA